MPFGSAGAGSTINRNIEKGGGEREDKNKTENSMSSVHILFVVFTPSLYCLAIIYRLVIASTDDILY